MGIYQSIGVPLKSTSRRCFASSRGAAREMTALRHQGTYVPALLMQFEISDVYHSKALMKEEDWRRASRRTTTRETARRYVPKEWNLKGRDFRFKSSVAPLCPS